MQVNKKIYQIKNMKYFFLKKVGVIKKIVKIVNYK